MLIKAGIKQAVVCPGSRNAAIVHNLQAAGIECFDITDERSAGFFAIGLIDANGGMPVAVCVTSGSAVLNLAPAISEAFYRNLPLIAITADRPTRWIGQMDGQTMPQPNAFGDLVAKCVSLPEPSDEESLWYCNRLINEALIEQKRTSKPVHINVPITEPMFDFSEKSLPEVRFIKWESSKNAAFVMSDSMIRCWEESKHILIIVGQMSPKEMNTCSGFLIQLSSAGCVVFAENLSNIHAYSNPVISPDEIEDFYIGNFDEILKNKPLPNADLIITLGGHIVSKRLKQHIRKNPPKFHWHVSPRGEFADLFMCCTHMIEADNKNLLEALCKECHTAKENSFKQEIHKLSKEAATNLDTTSSNAALKTLLPYIKENWNICVANSSMVRDLQKFFKGTNLVFCNRGINGIEGSSSAAVGLWIGSKRPTVLLTGDLSFFYDQNALWNKYAGTNKHDDNCVDAKQSKPAPLRIFLINNGCGNIFHSLPGLQSPYLEKSTAATHTTSAEGIAKQSGLRYLTASTIRDLEYVIPDFLNNDCDVALLEYFV